MEEFKKIKRSNIKIIIAIIFVILSSISIIITYNRYLEDERERIESSNKIKMEIENFNSHFEWAVGEYKTASMVKGLCKNIITSNEDYAENELRHVFIKEGDISQLSTRADWENSGAYYTAEDIAKLSDKIFSTDRYQVEICYEDTTGLVLGIGITQVEGLDGNAKNSVNIIKLPANET